MGLFKRFTSQPDFDIPMGLRAGKQRLTEGLEREKGGKEQSFQQAKALSGLQEQEAKRAAFREKKAGEGQLAESLLAGFGRQPEAERGLPEMPEERGIVEAFLKGTGLAEGTKLRSFIEGEVRNLALQKRGAREEWWRKMHAPEEEPETFEGEQAVSLWSWTANSPCCNQLGR